MTEGVDDNAQNGPLEEEGAIEDPTVSEEEVAIADPTVSVFARDDVGEMWLADIVDDPVQDDEIESFRDATSAQIPWSVVYQQTLRMTQYLDLISAIEGAIFSK